MSSPLAHVLAGSIIYRALEKKIGLPRGTKGYILASAIALVPDIDIFYEIALHVSNVHRGVTHSFAFLLLVCSLASFLFSTQRDPGKLLVSGLGLFCIGLTHLLLDYLMSGGKSLILFYPISKKTYHASIGLMPTAYYANSIKGFIYLLKKAKIWICFTLEFNILFPIFLFGDKRVKGNLIKWGLLLLSISSLTLTYILYN